MERALFEAHVASLAPTLEDIRQAAWDLHTSVGETYDEGLPYGHHLSMVADEALRWGHLVAVSTDDILPILFAAYYHDSIEDARLSYNDVTKKAKEYMTEKQAFMAAEIVYALTNEKGRTRAERAGERYLQGIRQTPYAPFLKLCDRLANMTYSSRGTNASNLHMQEVYAREWAHLLEAIDAHSDDARLNIPEEMKVSHKTV